MAKTNRRSSQAKTIQLRSAVPSAVKPFHVQTVKSILPNRGSHPNLKVTPIVITKILNELANCGVMRTACAAAAISMTQLGRLREVHPEVSELVALAIEYYRERIQETVHNRAIEGWDEPVFYQGRHVGSIRKFSDRLLELQARRFCPEYRDRSEVDVNVTGGVLVVHTPAVSKEDWLAERRKKLEADSVSVQEADSKKLIAGS